MIKLVKNESDKMKCVLLVQDREVTVTVCETETTANKFIKNLSVRELQKREDLLVADLIKERLYY